MLAKTRGILFKSIKYSENSVIAKIYTEEFGLESFIVNNIRTKKAAVQAAHLQPLSLLEAEIYQRGNANLQRIKELRRQPALHSLYSDMPKLSVVVFMQEVLNRVIIEKECNKALYAFIENELLWMHTADRLPGIYPSYFMLKLSRYLGFAPETDSWQKGHLFLPAQGLFVSHQHSEPPFFDVLLTEHIYSICTAPSAEGANTTAQSARRKDLLEAVLHFYRLHIDGFGELNSHKVLAEVLA